MDNQELLSQFAELLKEQTETLTGYVDKQIGEVNQRMDQRFNEVDQRFGEVNQRMDGLEQRMDQRFDEVNQMFKEQIGVISEMFDAQTNQVRLIIENDMSKRYDSLYDGYKGMREKQSEQDSKIEALQTDVEKIDTRLLAIENKTA